MAEKRELSEQEATMFARGHHAGIYDDGEWKEEYAEDGEFEHRYEIVEHNDLWTNRWSQYKETICKDRDGRYWRMQWFHGLTEQQCHTTFDESGPFEITEVKKRRKVVTDFVSTDKEVSPLSIFAFKDEETRGEFEVWFQNSGEQQFMEAMRMGPMVPQRAYVSWLKDSQMFSIETEEIE
jgi:hypothetical protein